MPTNEKTESQHLIELSTVYFFKGNTPRVIDLKDCGLPLESPMPGAFSAFYGYQSRQEGFMAAKTYADENRLNFTAIDFIVKLDHKQNSLMMKPEDLARYDFIPFHRFTRAMMDDVGASLAQALEARGEDSRRYDMAKPHLVLMQRPDLFAELLGQPAWEHVKVLAHPAKLAISEKPFSVGSIPFGQWGSVVEATCRIDPIRIDISKAPGQPAPDPDRPDAPSVRPPSAGSRLR